MFLEQINLSFIQPCTTDSKRIRIIATPSRDLSELFPYLNTYLKTAIYNKKGQTLTYNYGPKIIVITKDDIKVSKLLNETDAFETLDYIKDFINDCYEKKDSLKPSDEKRNLPSPFDVYEVLPRLNCGKCGESTCMAFAAKLVAGKYKPNMCSQVRAEGNEKMREELENIYLTLGYEL